MDNPKVSGSTPHFILNACFNMLQVRPTCVKFYETWIERNIWIPGVILVPVRWNCVIETQMRYHDNGENGIDILRALQLRDRTYHYILLFHQANVEQIEEYCRLKTYNCSSEAAVLHEKGIHVFGTRMTSLMYAFLGRDARPISLIELPLLSPALPACLEDSKRYDAVFWRGSCHHPIRKVLSKTIKEKNLSMGYNFSGVYPCGAGTSIGHLHHELSSYTWTLGPPGTFLPNYLMYEAIQCGSLPIIMTQHRPWKRERAVDSENVLKAMPYSDVIDWKQFAIAIDWDRFTELPNLLTAANVNLMQDYMAKHVAKWFSVDGMIDYVVLRSKAF
eukprot:m.9445 g.9445  ORF g.9445 m.9445 type:complete len:332 (-) comp4067_c0_seq1:875-1870(-)